MKTGGVLAVGLLVGVVGATPVSEVFARALEGACKAPEGKGTCLKTSECAGISYSTGLCPNDPNDVQCCVQIQCSVPAGDGFCRSAENNGCAGGSFHPGTQKPYPCSGGSDIQCCVLDEELEAVEGFGDAPEEEEIACSVPAGNGVCLSILQVGSNSAGTFHVGTHAPWPCPGGADIQCWVPTSAHTGIGDAPEEISCSVPAGNGVCLSVSNDGCSSGSFHPGTSYPWPCPGDDDIQCCVPDSDDDTKETPKPPTATKETPKPLTGGRSGGNGRIDQNSINLLKELEGFVPGVYDDGTGIDTIGYGHNCEAHPGTCEGLDIPLSKADGEKLMIGDLAGFEDCVCNLPNAEELNVNEFGALVSFAYNSGCGGVANHWKSYMQRKDFNGVCNDLPTTNTLKGLLTTRREKEQKLCRESTSVMSGC